jgi:type I restriction enzyme S subunit
MPSNQTIANLSPHLDAIYKKMAGNISASQTLTKLRDTLLPKLISGELRIPEAKQLIEKALA